MLVKLFVLTKSFNLKLIASSISKENARTKCYLRANKIERRRKKEWTRQKKNRRWLPVPVDGGTHENV